MKMAQSPNLSNEVSSTQVVVRFGLRIAILCVFANLGNAGFGKGFAVLLLMSAALCVAGGLLQCELLFGSTLSHWDEAAAYGALCSLTIAVSEALAS